MRPSRVVLGVLVALLTTVGAVAFGVVATGLPHPRHGPSSVVADHPEVQPSAPRVPEVSAAAVLAAWDAERARAWATGDVRRLGRLYVPGSAAGRNDRARLRAWVTRGLVVRGLRVQVLALREVVRTPSRWVLRVTDRVSAGTAVGHGVHRLLPHDAPTTHRLDLRRLHGRWLMAAVTPVGR